MTATKPKIIKGVYPTADDIAGAWIKKKSEDYYFRNNRLAGIRTADDMEIEAILDSL